MLKFARTWLRRLEVKFLLWELQRVAKPELVNACRNLSAEMALELATDKFMNMLDQEGFRHCFACPSRFGLKKLANGKMACKAHNLTARVNPEIRSASGSKAYAVQ